MTHEQLLESYARLTVRTGLNLQRDQQLVITAPLEAVALVRRITEHFFTWISVGNFRADFSYLLDPLSGIYILFIAFLHVLAVGTLADLVEKRSRL